MSLLLALAMSAAAATPALSCLEATDALAGSSPYHWLPGRIDGERLAGPDALATLRRIRGNAVITVVGGTWRDADFRGRNFRNICFVDTDLSGSDWRGVDARGIGFIDSDLTGARMQGARMRRILLNRTKLENVRASAADWSRGRFIGHWNGPMSDLDLSRANLRQFEFRCGILEYEACFSSQVSMRSADLSGARLDSLWERPDLAGARIDGTAVGFRQLQGLTAAELRGPVLLRGGDATVSLKPSELTIVARAIRPEVATAPGESPSFDCARARTRVEQMICARDAHSLQADDRDLAILYRRARAADPRIVAAQRIWLAERDRCPDAACVEQAYIRRHGRLLGGLGRPRWFRPGIRAMFVAEPVVFANGFRRTSLYRRLVPAIVGAAASKVAIRVNPDGTIRAYGEAIGGNAHMCGLSGESLRFDRATGWFSGPWSPTYGGPPDRNAPPMRVLRLEGERAEVFRNGQQVWDEDPVESRHNDYVLCGARAGFQDMIRVPTQPAAVDRMLAEHEGW
jgi:uncharacterized protein YjbI with pentapeptide repeats